MPTHIISPPTPGAQFGRLTFTGRFGRTKDRHTLCECMCSCGADARFYFLCQLRTGKTHSCGCAKIKHGCTWWHAGRSGETPEYSAWRNMKDRCLNPHCACYARYGGRGIAICQEWLHSFEAFFAYVGLKPTPSHTLDRYPNNNGNYEPGNVRWATRGEQASNRRSARILTINGEERSLSEWARISGIPLSTLFNRIARQCPSDKLLQSSHA